MNETEVGMHVALAIIYHDPHSRLTPLLTRVAPLLTRTFTGIAVQASPTASEQSLAVFQTMGALIGRDTPDQRPGALLRLGRARRNALRLAQDLCTSHTLYFDADRVLHWADRYPDELTDAVAHIADADMTIFGRTPRAFATHPQTQRDTEAIINRVFAAITTHAWDVTGAGRGLSQRATTALVDGCPDDQISVDVTWPLHLWQSGAFSIAYHELEGLEFETPDRYTPEVAAAGGLAVWMHQVDADPRRWAHRLNIARIQTEAMIPYGRADTHLIGSS
jgi:hypothetical protein